ncbi:MFS transporter [Bradyrhizobium sp.]|uniref:MFS transporter n=1 Tax=Bradyrhizobium sp. TaxID=376 RepID=UPI003C671B21
MLAIACGVMVGNIYLCQPLLAQIAQQFGIAEKAASLVAVATQIGYALGVLLIVPLADMAKPALLVRWLMALTTIGLAAAALSPNVPVLLVASVCFATVTVIPQIPMPLAPTLVAPEHRGRSLGALSTGLVLGILLSRTVSGAAAGFSGTWRTPFALAAILSAILLFIVPRFLPEAPSGKAPTRYRDLLGSLPSLLRHRSLLLSMGMNFCVFGGFSAFWAMLAFHLQAPSFALGPAAVGLFGLWGAPGALIAPVAGRFSDRFGSAPVNAAGLCATATSFAVAGTWGATSIIGLILAVNLLDFGLQSGQVANQTRIFGIGEAIRGRLNTVYMVATFSGGAVGALAGGLAWTFGGWSDVCLLGGGMTMTAGIMLTMDRLATIYIALQRSDAE